MGDGGASFKYSMWLRVIAKTLPCCGCIYIRCAYTKWLQNKITIDMSKIVRASVKTDFLSLLVNALLVI